MSGSISSQVARYASVFGPIGAVGGFISDVLQPLVPLSKWVFGISLVLTALLLFAVFFWRTFRPSLMPPLVLCAAFLVFSGALLAFQSKETEEKGVLATHFKALESLQSSLGVIQKDIADIKVSSLKTAESAARIEQSSQKTEQATQKIAQSTEKIATTLEAMQQSFSNLSKSGGVIENASRPEEHYSNARLFEQRGDYINARRAYNAYFAFKLDLLDPHLRYQTFLNVQEGRAGAREIYSGIYEQDKRPLIEFVRILAFDAPQRTEMLKAFVAAYGDFAPAYYELSREYSAARKGTQSLGDKKSELEALETFKKLNSEGKFLKYFVDKEFAAKWMEDADTRLNALALLKQGAGAKPINLMASRSNSGWLITLQMAEIPREIFYRLDGESEFQSTGLLDTPNPATGFKMPNMYFPLKASVQRMKIEVKYTDIGNELRGPYELTFDPDAALFDSQKQVLAMTKNSWVSFRDFDGKTLVYFTHLLTNRCALKEVAYGVDTDTVVNTFDLPECNPKDPYSVGDGNIYITVPNVSKYMTVRLTFKDGSKSEPQRIER